MDISEIPPNLISMAKSIKSDESINWYLKSNGINYTREQILKMHKDDEPTPKPTFREK